MPYTVYRVTVTGSLQGIVRPVAHPRVYHNRMCMFSPVVWSCFCDVFEMSVLSSVVSSKLSDVLGMCLFSSVVWSCFCDVFEMSVLSSVVSSKLSDVSGMCLFSSVVWSCLSRRGKRNPWDSGTTIFIPPVVLVCKVEGINFNHDICKSPLPSILISTADIAPLFLCNMCLTKNFSRWDASVSCNGLEVDEYMPSIDTVFNWVSGIKWHIYVKNVVTVGHILCCMLLLHKHKDTFVAFTHC